MPPALLLWLAALLCGPAMLVQSQRTCDVHEKCVPLSQCQSLRRLVDHRHRKPTDNEKTVLRAAQCGWSPTETYMPLVCCDLVSWGKCSVDLLDAPPKAANGPAPAMEFPWVARLVYRDEAAADKLAYGPCAASLISDRYLLTAARCVAGRDPPLFVRLGELDADADPDCNANGTDCAPAAFDAPVESVIAHPEYDAAAAAGHEHDIALVRMKAAVLFTPWVSPVCLPIKDPLMKLMEKNRPLTVLGWGPLDRTSGNATRLLTRSVLREVPHEVCAEKYKDTPHHVDGVHQMCGRGFEQGTDACHGDPGAPLTSSVLPGRDHRGVTVLEGVASFGSPACATDGMPAVFTRVSTYLPWIMTSIKLV